MGNDFASASNADAPLGDGPDARSVPVGRGASWWSEGWRLFTPAVGMWLLFAVILFALNLGLAFIPVIGHLAAQFLFPVLAGGLMLGCRAVDRGNPLTVAHLFGGFVQNTGPLLLVGLIYTALVFVIVLVVFGLLLAFFGAAVLRAIADPGSLDIANLALGSVFMAFVVGALLFVALLLPLIMAVWFAPALIVLRNVDAATAMKLSFVGGLKNFIPFLVYGIVGIVLAIVASIPFGLGWLVLGPVTIATVYASYCDIFEERAAV